MDRMAYLAMTGARQTELAQAVTANNLANASTTGFRADLHAFNALQVQGAGSPTRHNAIAEQYATDFRPGAIQSTGRDLDVAVNGAGFLVVQTADGGEALTRAGDLRLNNAGQLLTNKGDPVIGEGGPIAIPPSASITIATDGTISVQILGQGPANLSTVDRLRLANPPLDVLEKGSDGLFRRTDGLEYEPDAAVTVTPGALESSNVNVAEALVSMIALARQYEMQVKSIMTAEENAEVSSALLRIR